MSQLTADSRVTISNQVVDDYAAWRWYMLPLVFAVAIDLLTPQLVDWHLVPKAVRWLGDAAIMAMIIIAIMRMLFLDRIPKVFLIVLGVTILGFAVALFEGQSVGATAYGLRRLFQYPLIGLYVYMMPQWPPWSAKWLLRICLYVLGFEAFFQVLQFASGQQPSDNLAGSFGPHGVGPLIMFTLLVVSFGLGKWLADGEWRYLVLTLVFGVISSSLGQMKLFPIAVLILAGLAFLIQLIKGGQIRKLLIIAVLLAIGVLGYVVLYNTLVAGINEDEFQHFLSLEVLNDYFGGTRDTLDGFKLSRNSEPVYVWNNNLKSTSSFLFGRGIGSRAQSETLGIAGTWYDTSFYTAGPGRSLPVLLQETGVVGLLTFTLFCFAAIMALFKNARTNGTTDLAAVQYGLILYTVYWPLWLWYLPVWLQAVPMMLYWISLGFS